MCAIQPSEDVEHPFGIMRSFSASQLIAFRDPEASRPMFQFLAHRIKHTSVGLAPTLLTLATLAVFAGSSSRMAASTLFFSGNLRTDATVTDCGSSCTLGSSDTDFDYAQFAAVVNSFTVASTSTMSAITYSYGGGTSLTGASVASGGLEPYLSLFDASGNFLASTYFGTTCPLGANTYDGNCYDESLDGGTLAAGTYYIALTAFENMSYAENSGVGTLSDGFTGIGDLQSDEDLHYGFDVILTPDSGPPPAVPEPNYVFLMGIALGAPFLLKSMKLRADTHA
jgi:hypothetical protein